jgi:hypothetical protein
MSLEKRKLDIIAEVLKINNDVALSALEIFLINLNSKENTKHGFDEFFGIWSKEEAEEIERLIGE